MAIVDGNPVDAAYTNSQVVNNDTDETITGVITLDNDNGTSGATIPNLQKCLNDLKALMLLLLDIVDPVDLVTTGDIDQEIDGNKTFLKPLQLDDHLYFGDPDADGTWRIDTSSGSFVIEVRVAGNYEVRSSHEA